jgi:micrococcal nuclease
LPFNYSLALPLKGGLFIVKLLITMYDYQAKITNVVDGDTVDAEVDLGFTVKVLVRFRLAGINTPEVTGVEKVEGKRVKEIVKAELLDKQVILKSSKIGKGVVTDKYGRWLARIFLNDVDYNQSLVDRGMAVVYME